MRKYLVCLVGLLLVHQLQGQNSYYSEPAPKRITVYVGLNFQYLSPLGKYAISNERGEGTNLQLGAIYSLPVYKSFSISPELAIRQNGADLTYKTPIPATYDFQVRGISTQLLLPLKYTLHLSRKSNIGLAGGLFVELPVNMRIKEDWLNWNPNNLAERVTITDVAVHEIGKGWQLAAEYNITSFQIRLYLADRGAMGQDNIKAPSTRITGFTLGVNF